VERTGDERRAIIHRYTGPPFTKTLDRMESIALEIAAPILGLFLGTFLFSRVGAWVQALATAAKASSTTGASRGNIALIAVLHSGPWLLAGVVFWAYHVLSDAHQRAWDWFFGAVVVSIPVWFIVLLYLHHRAKRIQAAAAREHNAV